MPVPFEKLPSANSAQRQDSCKNGSRKTRRAPIRSWALPAPSRRQLQGTSLNARSKPEPPDLLGSAKNIGVGRPCRDPQQRLQVYPVVLADGSCMLSLSSRCRPSLHYSRYSHYSRSSHYGHCSRFSHYSHSRALPWVAEPGLPSVLVCGQSSHELGLFSDPRLKPIISFLYQALLAIPLHQAGTCPSISAQHGFG